MFRCMACGALDGKHHDGCMGIMWLSGMPVPTVIYEAPRKEPSEETKALHRAIKVSQ